MGLDSCRPLQVGFGRWGHPQALGMRSESEVEVDVTTALPRNHHHLRGPGLAPHPARQGPSAWEVASPGLGIPPSLTL